MGKKGKRAKGSIRASKSGSVVKGKKRIKAVRREYAAVKQQRAKSEERERLGRETAARKRLRKAKIPYENSQSILLVGEGNFSFALALVKAWDPQGPQHVQA